MAGSARESGMAASTLPVLSLVQIRIHDYVAVSVTLTWLPIGADFLFVPFTHFLEKAGFGRHDIIDRALIRAGSDGPCSPPHRDRAPESPFRRRQCRLGAERESDPLLAAFRELEFEAENESENCSLRQQVAAAVHGQTIDPFSTTYPRPLPATSTPSHPDFCR